MVSQPDAQAYHRRVQELVERLGLPIKKLALITHAFTHRSYVNENQFAVEDNERLEFLGDAVLDFLVGAWVYNHFPEMQEGDLTKLRSALVRTDQLAAFARRLDFGSVLRLGRGELNSGGSRRDSLLCGAFEAFVGAVYLETDIQTVEKFIEPLLEMAREPIFARSDLSDFKSRLQVWAQGEKLGAPLYKLVGKSGPDHDRTFEVEVHVDGKALGRGSGSNKSAAEQEAAKAALKSLGLG